VVLGLAMAKPKLDKVVMQ